MDVDDIVLWMNVDDIVLWMDVDDIVHLLKTHGSWGLVSQFGS